MAFGNQLKVLLLEDQAVVRQGMRALMQLCEPEAVIQEAASFEDAVRLLSEDPADIAFLDVDLKGEKSGLDLLQHIRQCGLVTRAIMLSGHTDEPTVMGAIRSGASGYIPKDTEGDGVFRRALDTIFQGGIFLPAEVLGKGGFSPQPANSAATALEDLGIKGRPLEALYYLCQGLSNQLIAYRMGVSEATVANDYNTKLFKKFKVSNRTSLIVEVSRRGIKVPTPDSARQSDDKA